MRLFLISTRMQMLSTVPRTKALRLKRMERRQLLRLLTSPGFPPAVLERKRQQLCDVTEAVRPEAE